MSDDSRSKKASEVYESLKNQILSGELPVGHRLPPEKELASCFGVAGLTLRKALKSLRQEGWITSQRYHGTRIADPSASKPYNKLIGLLLPESLQALSNPAFARLADGIEGVLCEKGYARELAVSNPGNPVQERTLLAKLADPSIDGWLIPTAFSAPVRQALEKLRKPKVLLHIVNPAISDHCLEMDYLGLATDILRHLSEQGYRKICVIGPQVVNHARLLEAMSLLVNTRLVPSGLMIRSRDTVGYAREEGRQACLAALSEGPADAFVCADDELASGVLAALQERGLNVPATGVIGAGDFPVGATSNPPLTTLSYPYFQTGRQAAYLLTDLIEGKIREAVHHRYVVKLIARESTLRQFTPHNQTP